MKTLIFLALIGYNSQVNAQDIGFIPEKTHCVSIDINSNPAAGPESKTTKQRWCYTRSAPWAGNQQVLVYNADHPQIAPEQSVLLELDDLGNPKSYSVPTRTHGKVEFLKTVQLAVSPLPVPLAGTLAADSGLSHTASIENNETRLSSGWIKQIAYIAKTAANGAPTLQSPLLEVGNFQAFLPAESLPWRGYWWPNAVSALADGKKSPLAKYDKIVFGLTGINPGSYEWERSHHSTIRLSWAGHCNGWAASTILYPEPNQYLIPPPELGVKYLSPFDLKGMLAEASFCVDYVMYGTPFKNKEDIATDVNPLLFHQALIQYIGQMKKPLIMDAETFDHVDNQVISGYSMTITKADYRKFMVTVSLKAHKYDLGGGNDVGVAPSYSKNLSYFLYDNGAGVPVTGEWISKGNPDFLWYPLAPRDGCIDDFEENPGVKTDMIARFFREFPVYKK